MSINVFRLASSINNCYSCRYDSLDIFKYEFPTNGDVNGWDLFNNIYMFGAWDNSLFGYASDRSCYIGRTENFLPVEAEHYHIIRITMKIINNNSDTFKGQESLKKGRIKWISLEETIWDDLKYQDFDLHTDGLRHTYTIDVGPNSSWVGNIIGLRIYPFIDGWKGDNFYISSIRLGSDDKFSCLNNACSYNSKYSHPCKGAGLPGTITSVVNSDENDTFTTISGVNDALSINIDGYGYETFNLGTNISVKGVEFAKIVNRSIAALGMGSYAYVVVEYTVDKRLKIRSGSIGEGGSIYIANNAAARNLGFCNEVGVDVSTHTYGTDCADGFSYLSTRLLTVEEIYRLIDGDFNTTSYTHTPKLSCVSAGRVDYYTTIKESPSTRINALKYKISYGNRLKTLIDISHPIDSNGILKTISVAGDIIDDDQAKAMVFRPLKNGTLKTIYKFDFIIRDSFMSSDPMFYKIDCNVYVQRGDVIGFYNFSPFYGRGIRTKPDARFYHISGEVEGVFDPGNLKNYGVSGFAFYCEGESNQQNIVLDIDFGSRLNIKNMGVYGKLEAPDELCNICLCKDVSFTVNLYNANHRHKTLYGYDVHDNKAYGLDALTDGERMSNNGVVGDSHGSDSNGLWTSGRHSYFYVNGDDEFRDAQNPAQDFEDDPVELTVLWDYNTPLKISKVAIYFKDSYNFRNMEISYYLGYYDASGDSTNSEYFKRINYNKVYLNGVLQDKEKNAFVYQNPTASKPIFEKGKCINGDVIRTAASSRWFLYECEFDPVDSYGLRIFSDHHRSTKIMEIEVYVDYGVESSLNNAMYLRSSKEGDLWSDTEFLKISDGEFIGYVGDSPRYLQFEISSLTPFSLKEITAELDDNIKSIDCETTLLLEHAKDKSVNIATPMVVKNTYDVALDLDVSIEKNVSIPNKMILYNTVGSEEELSNSVVGAGGFVDKYMTSYPLKTIYSSVAAGAQIYCLTNLFAGKKYYYKQGDCPWEEKGTIYDNGYITGVNRGFDWKINRLEFDTTYGKYFEIGVYSPDYNSEIGALKVYYLDEILPIEKVKVGIIDELGDDGRTEVNYNNDINILSGKTIFKDNFDTGELSSLWEVDDPMAEWSMKMPSLHVDDEGLRFRVSYNEYPKMTMVLDRPVVDFEIILDIERDLLCEEDHVGDQWYMCHKTPIFSIRIELLGEDDEIIGSIKPMERDPGYYDSGSWEDPVRKIHTLINTTSMDPIESTDIPKSRLTIKRVHNTFYVNSDLTEAFGKVFDERTIKMSKKPIYKIRIVWGRGLLNNYYQVLFYGDKDWFDNRVYTPEESTTNAQTCPHGYLNYVLKSIEIKSIPSLRLYKRLYIEFDTEVYLNKIELYSQSFRLGRSLYEDETDPVAVIGIRKSNDGISYNMHASTESEMLSYCFDTEDYIDYKGSKRDYLPTSTNPTNVFDRYTQVLTYYSNASSPPGGLNDAWIYHCYRYLRTACDFVKYPYYERNAINGRNELIEFRTPYITYDFGAFNAQVFDKIEFLFVVNSVIHIDNIYIRGSNDGENWETIYHINDPYNTYSGFEAEFQIIVKHTIHYDRTYTFDRIVIEDLPQVPYRYIRFNSDIDSDFSLYSLVFKLAMSETNTIQLTWHDYEDWVAIDLGQQHSIGWVRHWNNERSNTYAYNSSYKQINNRLQLSANSEQIEYSSTETPNIDEVVWGSNPSLKDVFLDGFYNDNWEFVSVSGGMIIEDVGFLGVYTYGDSAPGWHGVTITHNFDKAEYIDLILDFNMISTGVCKGRTSIVFKDVTGVEEFKVVVENIDSNIIEYVYDGGELVYSDSGFLSAGNENTIRLKREIMPSTFKYYAQGNILYFEDAISENKVNRMDITFEKYDSISEISVHNITYVSLDTVAALSHARWVKLILYNTAYQLIGNNVKYLSAFPDITKVSTPDGKVNCEWEQFPYSLTTKEKQPDLARFKPTTSNYPQFQDYNIENTVNGDISGRSGLWAFDILDNGDYPYIELDLGQEYNIKEIALYHGRYKDDTAYVNANIYTDGQDTESFISIGTVSFKMCGLNRERSTYVTDAESLYYYGYDLNDGYGIRYPNILYNEKIHIKIKIYVADVNILPVINVVLYEDKSVRRGLEHRIIIATARLHIDGSTVNDQGVAQASCIINCNTAYRAFSGIELICVNYKKFSKWGFQTMYVYAYTVGLNSYSPIPCQERDSGYIIEASTTASGLDFEYLCPMEIKRAVSAIPEEPYAYSDYGGWHKQVYYITFGGSRYDRSHYYQEMPVRRLRITFKKWQGDRLTYENEDTGKTEVFTGSFLRGIEVFEAVDVARLNGVMVPKGMRLPRSLHPTVNYVGSKDYPIIACDLNAQYDIKNVYIDPGRSPWRTYALDVRYSDSMSSDPSEVKFSAKNEVEEIFYSSINTGILSFPDEEGGDFITEVELGSNIYLDSGLYTISFEAYNVTAVSKMSFLFSGNEEYECNLTTIASGTEWEPFEETIDIEEMGYYTFSALQNMLYEESWGIRYPRLSVLQGQSKRWVSLIERRSFGEKIIHKNILGGGSEWYGNPFRDYKLRYFEVGSATGLSPTSNSIWWESEMCELTTEKLNLKEGSSGIRINYPSSTFQDHIRFVNNDSFYGDSHWNIENVLSFWLYVSDIDLVNVSECVVVFGNEEERIETRFNGYSNVQRTTGPVRYYVWYLTNHITSSGWNKIQLRFSEYSSVYPASVFDKYTANKKIDKLLNLKGFKTSTFSLYIQGTGDPFYMILDTIKYERLDFVDVEDTKGLLLLNKESLHFNPSNLSLKYGTIEFDVMLSSNSIGADIFGNVDSKTLFSLLTNTNEMMSLLISAAKGFNMCVGKINDKMIATDFYYESGNPSFYIHRNEIVHLKAVWSHDGEGMDNANTFRLYVNDKIMFSIDNKWAITSNFVSSIVFGGVTTAMVESDTDGSGTFFNIKVYNYCKIDSIKSTEVKFPNDFLEISKDNENFYKLSSDNLPLKFEGINPGGEVTIYVRANKTSGFNEVTNANGEIMLNWILIV